MRYLVDKLGPVKLSAEYPLLAGSERSPSPTASAILIPHWSLGGQL